MSCLDMYASAVQFGAFWCISGYVKGNDDSGLAGQPSLQDLDEDFISIGIEANKGMVLYNLTQGTSGAVTAVTSTSMTATGVTWDDGDEYEIAALTGAEIDTIEMYLTITAADISAALAASGACECTWQSWVSNYLAKLNVIEAAVFYTCPCGNPQLSDEAKSAFLDWATTQLDNLRNGTVIVCEGDTGKEYPAFGWAEINHTQFSEAEIIDNYLRRNT